MCNVNSGEKNNVNMEITIIWALGGSMELISKRVYYRLFQHNDFELFYSVFSNREIMRYAWIDEINSIEEMKPFFEGFISVNDMPNKNNSYAFAAFERENGSFIGFTDIQIHSLNDEGGHGEIGYFLLPEFWGKGYATELASTMMEFGFNNLNLHKVSARCNANNLKSENIMKKLGMTKEGQLRKVRYKRGSWDDEKCYGILREEWLEKKDSM